MIEKILTVHKESLEILEKIETQIGTSFHKHNHVLLDIAKDYFEDIVQINYLEIGTYKGASALLMAHRPKTKIITIDKGEPITKSEQQHNFQTFNPEPENKIISITGYSHAKSTLDEVKKYLNTNNVDILFIDGDHSREGVRKDFEIYSPLVASGGFIIFDDYEDPSSAEVKPAVDQIVEECKADWEVISLPKNVLPASPKELKNYNVLIMRKK